jgi:hypothetical protein
MGANQNSSQEIDLYPKINLKFSLLIRPRPPSYYKLSAFKIGLGTTTKTQNGASKTTSEINDKNQIEEQFISSQVFH